MIIIQKHREVYGNIYRDEPALNANGAVIDFPAVNHNGTSFNFKQRITGKTGNG